VHQSRYEDSEPDASDVSDEGEEEEGGEYDESEEEEEGEEGEGEGEGNPKSLRIDIKMLSTHSRRLISITDKIRTRSPSP
jgi:hypothetical protein